MWPQAITADVELMRDRGKVTPGAGIYTVENFGLSILKELGLK